MNPISRFIHRVKARRYARLAALLQRNLTEYVLVEESRISVYLHRAGWHMARSKPRADSPPTPGAPSLADHAPKNGHIAPPVMEPRFFIHSNGPTFESEGRE
ncbi:MAG TPA: hypothetical protein VIM61_05040 [Chthoniobacterales bacterium]|jgi:hypothetical protein